MEQVMEQFGNGGFTWCMYWYKLWEYNQKLVMTYPAWWDRWERKHIATFSAHFSPA